MIFQMPLNQPFMDFALVDLLLCICQKANERHELSDLTGRFGEMLLNFKV